MTDLTDLTHLRKLAEDPIREAMPRSRQFPSLSEELVSQKQELNALRRGLREAIAEIERMDDYLRSLVGKEMPA